MSLLSAVLLPCGEERKREMAERTYIMKKRIRRVEQLYAIAARAVDHRRGPQWS